MFLRKSFLEEHLLFPPSLPARSDTLSGSDCSRRFLLLASAGNGRLRTSSRVAVRISCLSDSSRVSPGHPVNRSAAACWVHSARRARFSRGLLPVLIS